MRHFRAAHPIRSQSAATMAFLINKAKEEQIPVILKMELSNENIANATAETTHAKVKTFLQLS